jgi:phage tail sheath protein FI
MPEYLAPGVYVEETSFRSKPIEGVSTTTTAFIGPTRDGPIFGEPPLLTSFQEFSNVYGGMDPLGWEPSTNYLAQAVRAFFEEGGKRLYVARTFKPISGGLEDPPARIGVEWSDGIARWEVGDDVSSHPATPPDALQLRARYPGASGNRLATFRFHLGANVLDAVSDPPQLKGVDRLEVVWVQTAADAAASPTRTGRMYWVDTYFDAQGRLAFRLRRDDPSSSAPGVDTLVDLGTLAATWPVTVSVEVIGSMAFRGRFELPKTFELLTFHPAALAPAARRSLFDELAEPPAPQRVELYAPIAISTPNLVNGVQVAELLAGRNSSDGSGTILDALADQVLGGRPNGDSPPRLEPVSAAALSTVVELRGGNDGQRPSAASYPGFEGPGGHKSGLLAFEDLEDVSILAAPGSTAGGANGYSEQMRAITGFVLSHCERMKYRVAVLDSADGVLPGEIRDERARLDSKYGALYYPWVLAFDPITEAELALPPSGFVTGIYARSDIERGVHKAPANEVVRLATGLELAINRSQQEALNPLGVNCLRWFEGRGFRVWGARTITSDPEWRYVNLRRNWCYLGRSIELGTQWAVFEPNAEELWGNVRRAVEDFLFNEWKSGRLAGVSPDEAYFVRCDRTTMTQSDVDNGRLICLVGVALLRPAEFVIFRIGQKTLDFKAA